MLHSYANAAHERRVKEILEAEWKGVTVVLSSDVLPESGEYERTVTTCVNTALMPVMAHYLKALGRQVEHWKWRAPLLVMQSSGGLISARAATQKPLSTALSGPSAAAVGMAWLGRHAGFPNLITIDMGGTSTDVSLVKEGYPLMTTAGRLHVYPLRMPMVDIVSIGAGGGSIAWWGLDGRMHVGPRSAGADPGPVCYARGGKAVTVTDAHLVLARLPAQLLGGALPLDRGGAEQALAEFGKRRGHGPVEVASGIIQITNHSMCGAIRRISVRRGHDPRAYTLLAMGGAGPLHGTELADLLGIPTIVIPPTPGLAAASGLLVADLKADFVQTLRQREHGLDVERVARTVTALEQRAREALAREGVPAEHRRFTRAVDFQYVDMSAEWTIDLPGGAVTRETLDQAIENFHRLHQQTCGHSYRGQKEVELINLRISAVGVLPKPRPPTIPAAAGRPTPTGRRQVFFLDSDGFVDCPLYARGELGAGASLTGPAVVEQYDSTLIVSPRWRAEVDSFGNLILERG